MCHCRNVNPFKMLKFFVIRLDNLQSEIVLNQTYALSNLTAKIESEMTQVWRQIGIVYQQLTASRTALDGLTVMNQTVALSIFTANIESEMS